MGDPVCTVLECKQKEDGWLCCELLSTVQSSVTRKLSAVSIDGRIISLSPHYGMKSSELGV